MKEKTCPNCKTKVFKDPQHCPVCQNGLRAARLNLPGRIVMILVPLSLVALLVAVITLIVQFVGLPDKDAVAWMWLAGKIGLSCLVWYAVFWFIGQFEFLVTVK